MEQQNQIAFDLIEVDNLIRRGELIEAFDLALTKLKIHPNSTTMKHRAVLCLINAGALEAASQTFDNLELYKVTDDEDILCLKGKILKVQALEKQGENAMAIALLAAKQYEVAYALRKDHYPGINFATMLLLAGNQQASQTVAREVLESLNGISVNDIDNAYYYYASKSEACLLLGMQEQAEAALEKAISLDPANYRARSTTLKQFELILRRQNIDPKWLQPFMSPLAIHYGGYIFSTETAGHRPIDKASLLRLEDRVSSKLMGLNIGFGYGSLAAGADIVVAETILAQAAELHIILPCNKKDFVERSVRPYGLEWVERFNACIKRATSVQIVSKNLFILDDALLKFSSQVAMGKTIMRANALAIDALQFLIWDGAEIDKKSITYSDYKFWKKNGLQQVTETFSTSSPPCLEKHSAKANNETSHERAVIAMLFTDFHKFGELNETQVGVFVQHILKPLSQKLKNSGFKPLEVNTWGDGLFLAFENINEAADCALLFQKSFEKINLAALGLPEDLSMRIGANYGPVFHGIDNFLDRPTVFGSNVTFAARIEPIAVPGSTYVSESFASVLATQMESHYRCEYIGRVKLHKSDEVVPIYSLRARGEH